MRHQSNLMLQFLRLRAGIIALTTLLLTGAAGLLSAQSPIFSRQFKSTGTDASVITHLATLDGGTIELVDQRKVSDGSHYMDLLKSDAQGNLEWTKRFGPLLFGLKNIVQSPDSSYFLCFTQNPFGHFYEMIKLDPDGNVLFDQRANLPASNRVGIFPMSIARNDGGYYVGCTIFDTISGILHWHVFSLDASGTLLWSNSYNADFFTSDLCTMDTSSNGDVILAGMYYDLNQQKYMTIVTRVNAAGAVQWSKKISTANIYDFYPREITSVGNNIVLALVAYNSVAVSSSTVIIKLDGSGTISWSKIYTNNVRQIDPFDILPVENGNLAVTGTAFTPNIASYFMKVDSVGTVVASRVYLNWNIHTVQRVNGYQYSISGSYNDSLYPQAAYMTTDINGEGCADAAITIAALPISFTTANTSGFQSFPFTMIAGTTPSPAASYTPDDICRVTGIAEQSDAHTDLAIFPSPANEVIHLAATKNIGRVEILNLQGQILIDQSCGATACEIYIGALPSGCYLIRVVQDYQIITRKILIE